LDEETLARWHGQVDRGVVVLERDFSFSDRKVLDIGSSYGNTLLYWAAGSVGVELRPECIQFLSRFGYRTVALNVEDEFELDERFQAVYCNNLIEHLVAPHLLLANAFAVLEEGGLLALGHPVTPVYPVDQLWAAVGRKGWLAQEHINFFSCRGIEHCLERAGFRVVRQYARPFDRLGVDRIPALSRILGAFSTHCLTVCQKVGGYKYPAKRLQAFDPQWARGLKVFRPH
jgi:SAM-dependent methyltransferase